MQNFEACQKNLHTTITTSENHYSVIFFIKNVFFRHFMNFEIIGLQADLKKSRISYNFLAFLEREREI